MDYTLLLIFIGKTRPTNELSFIRPWGKTPRYRTRIKGQIYVDCVCMCVFLFMYMFVCVENTRRQNVGGGEWCPDAHGPAPICTRPAVDRSNGLVVSGPTSAAQNRVILGPPDANNNAKPLRVLRGFCRGGGRKSAVNESGRSDKNT